MDGFFACSSFAVAASLLCKFYCQAFEQLVCSASSWHWDVEVDVHD